MFLSLTAVMVNEISYHLVQFQVVKSGGVSLGLIRWNISLLFSVEEAYMLKVWEREIEALPSEIPLPPHPYNPSRTVPYGAVVDFGYMPVYVVPTSVLL